MTPAHLMLDLKSSFREFQDIISDCKKDEKELRLKLKRIKSRTKQEIKESVIIIRVVNTEMIKCKDMCYPQ